MTAIVIPYTFVAGTTARANEVNDNYTAVTAVVNGNIDNSNISASAAIALSKLALTTELFILRSTGNRNVSAGITGDTVPRLTMTSDGWLSFGPGGASALDTMLRRTAAAQISLRDQANSAYADLLLKDLTASGAGAFTGNLSGAKITASGTILANTTAQILATLNGFRCSVVSGNPVGEASGAGTLYLEQFKHGLISLFDGTNWIPHYSAGINLAFSVTSGLPADYFVYNNSGTLTLEKTDWTNATTRATALVRQDGVLCKSGALTRRWVCTVLPSASNQVTDDSSARGVFNADNRVLRSLYTADTTDSWTYASATFQEARAQSTNGVSRFSFLVADPEAATYVFAINGLACVNTATVRGICAIGLDNATPLVAATNGVGGMFTPAVAENHQGWATYFGKPTLGSHFLARLEACSSAATVTFYGDGGLTTFQSGMIGGLMC